MRYLGTIQRILNALDDLLTGKPDVLWAKRHLTLNSQREELTLRILKDHSHPLRELRYTMLRNSHTLDHHLPRVIPLVKVRDQAIQTTTKSRLPATAGTGNYHILTFLHLQINIYKRGSIGSKIRERDALNFHNRHGS